MKRAIGTPLALFGLLLAAAMVCTTSAQGPKPEAPTIDPSAPRPATRAADFKADPPASAAPATIPAGGPPPAYRVVTSPDEFPPPYPSGTPPSGIPPAYSAARSPNGRATPLVVGRYQALSHNGVVILLDTATGECFSHEGAGWREFALPIEPSANPVTILYPGSGGPEVNTRRVPKPLVPTPRVPTPQATPPQLPASP
jgi:hypothetical protein